MKKFIYIIALFIGFSALAQNPTKFKNGIILPNATEVVNPTRIPIIDTNGTIKDFITILNLSPLVSTAGGGALEVIDEGNGDAIVIAGRNPLFYGNAGFNVVDLSRSISNSSTKGATGSRAFAAGVDATASGNQSVAIGRGAIATNSEGLALGYNASATGSNATAIGRNNTASNTGALSIGGQFNTSSGFFSIAAGSSCASSGNVSVAIGTNAIAKSSSEVALGAHNTDYTPNSISVYDASDRAFVIGNGVNVANKSDAFTILKSAQVGVDIDNFEANTTGEKLQVNGKIKATNLKLTGLPIHADEASAVTAGLTTGDVYRTSTGELRIKL
ncbi:hypothetical protein [Lacinutrix sp. Hel_I_90]|uniref:hypothetical protein n=1 Tax=Lacinutrix sp. Hel_I_90 TaxID=1249999 RepID=UPI0005CABEAD|nr:hypothetical protein [Lacinutrix sp. Hel_I_90]